MEIDCPEVVHEDGLPNGVHKGEDASTVDRSQSRLDCGPSNGIHDKQVGLLNKDRENCNTVEELADLHQEKDTLIRADLAKETEGESKDEVLLSVSDVTPAEEVSKAQFSDVCGHKQTTKIAQNGIAVEERMAETLFTSETCKSKDLEAWQGLPDDGHQGRDMLGDTFREQKASAVAISDSECEISRQVSGGGSVSHQENAENMDQDVSIALWVKWRGKWQAGIRCSRDDCPLSTLKAKPTHGRKKYIVVFFPQSRIHCWADTSLICSITERPEPLAYRTHYIGMELVKDLNAPRRFVMQKLAATMLDTSDKLHIEAVVESARKVTAWKEFAKEASKCETYSDLGRMLLKLQNMILSNYISSRWLEHSFNSWACHCQNAGSAASVEILMKELMDTVLWDEVSDLWDAPEQPNLGSEWKIMKQEAMKLLSISHPVASTVEGDQKNCVDMVVSGLPISRKRQKLEVRRSETHQSSMVPHSHEPHLQAVNEETSGMVNDTGCVKDVLAVQKHEEDNFLEENMLVGPGGNGLEQSSGFVAKDVQQVYPLTVDVSAPLGSGTSSNLQIVVHAASSSGKKDRQCIAFVESKGRQCGRWANVGDIYCAKHLNFVSPQNVSKPKQPLSLSSSSLPLCGGTTTSGKRCKHRSRDGSGYCLKHKDASYQMLQIPGPSGLSINKLKRKRRRKRKSSRYVGLETVTGKEIVLVDDVPLQESSRLSMARGDLYQQMYMIENHVLASSSTATKGYSQDVRRCYGWCRKNDDQCLRKPKHDSSFCEKHTPSWFNCDNQYISYEIFNDLVNNVSSAKQKAHLYRASELLYELMKNSLSEDIIQDMSRERFMEKILSDVSGDKSVAENLLRLVSGEREKLKRIWGFDENKETNCTEHISSIKAEPLVPAAREHNHNSVVEQMKRCKFCPESFSDDQSLGLHWIKSHKKEAQWLFRGYACGICKVSFTNRKVLIGHVEERHAGQPVDQSILFLCMTCNNHFSNFEQLWLHVVAAHSADLSTQDIQHHKQSLKSSMHGNFEGQPKMECSQKLSPKKRKTSEKHSVGQHHADRKFFCRFCGLKFDLLPDLGRHHQAAHMGPNSMTPFSPKKSDHSISSRHNFEKHLQHRLKNSSPEINRRTSSFGVKEPLERLDFERSKMLGPQTELNERANVKSMERYCSDIAKILFSAVQRTNPRPSSLDILAIARTTCCRANLHATLEMKYGSLPEKLYLKAAKLCSELNVQIQWHQDGYICPKSCKPLADQSVSLSPLPHDFSITPSLPPDSQFLSSDANGTAWEMDESHCIFKAVSKPRSFKSIVLCEDLSFGKEAVPVPCVVDEYLTNSFYTYTDGVHRGGGPDFCMPWKDFTYITTRMLDPSLGLDTKSSQLGCTCPGGTCSPDVCDHVYLFNNDYENAVDIHGKSMRGRFPYDQNGQIILEEGFLVYECNSLCSCDMTCQNRVLQKGVQVKLEVYKTENKGWAVRAGEAIPRGAFVCEYLGEVLDDQNANKRGERYDSEGCSYLYDIDAHIEENGLNEGAVPYVIDATKYGNVARFINHSCSPNLMNYQVLVESMDCQLAHIGLYTSRDIAAGEELAYDYRYKLLPGKGCPCHCGAANCRGRLY
ncbi:Histone-lysine N-methyltransferase [Nymphaea thermarum]|nr:Histone-lysine N-methyltransferase [Nymphaea thermarum]